MLLNQNRDLIGIKDNAGRTPLHHTVFMEANQQNLISQLIQYGANVNALDNDKRTPLHHAAESGKISAIEILCKNGAHTTVKDSLMRKTPIELACNNKVRQKLMAMVMGDAYVPEQGKSQDILQSK
jgi:ankyrin repeat protein